MGLVTFSLANLLFSFTVRDHLRSVFRRETLDDAHFLAASAISIVAIILGTSTRFLQRILQTVALDLNQWIICALTASSIVIASEIYKAIQRGRVGGSSGTETESVRALTNADPQFTRNG